MESLCRGGCYLGIPGHSNYLHQQLTSIVVLLSHNWLRLGRGDCTISFSTPTISRGHLWWFKEGQHALDQSLVIQPL